MSQRKDTAIQTSVSFLNFSLHIQHFRFSMSMCRNWGNSGRLKYFRFTGVSRSSSEPTQSLKMRIKDSWDVAAEMCQTLCTPGCLP